MALRTTTLRTRVQMFSDQMHPLFEGFPKNIPENSEKWANAIEAFASVVNPGITLESAVTARQAFLDEMNLLTQPETDNPNPLPFTLYYKSSEQKMLLFNRYLVTRLGYKPNPKLDKSQTFTILNNIRNTYNLLYPIVALTDEDIYYNQSRFNTIYATEIAEGRKFNLLSDGVTINTAGLNNNTKYNHIPVNKEGIIVPLQVDGIIGDDTIRYWPVVKNLVYQVVNSKPWNIKYSTIPYITQPDESGQVFIGVPTKTISGDYNVQNRYSNFKFKRDFIDKGLCKDYTKVKIDKTQFQIDGGLFSKSNDSVTQYINAFEVGHSQSDRVWIKNGIKTLAQFEIYSKKTKKDYDALPSTKKDGIKILENAIIAYARELAIGMAPDYTAAPNPIPISFAPVTILGSAGGSNAQCIEALVTIISSYFKTGLATDNTTGITINWS